MIENTSPCSTSKLTASTARIPPNRMAISSGRNNIMEPPLRPWGWRGWVWWGANSPSPQPLRPCIRFLPPEHRPALQRICLEPVFHLEPAAIDAARLEQDHHHQHQPVQGWLQTGHAPNPERQVVADDGDELRQQPHEDRAQHGAMQRAQATDKHNGDELHRQI